MDRTMSMSLTFNTFGVVNSDAARRTAGLGHERGFRDVRDKSGLPPTPERLRQRGEPTLRAKRQHRASASKYARHDQCQAGKQQQHQDHLAEGGTAALRGLNRTTSGADAVRARSLPTI
jgi:hypothetical protein